MTNRLAACVLALGFALGCSFVEELDKSSAEMDKYSPKAREAAKAKAAAEAEKKAGTAAGKAADATAAAKEAAAQWWGKARTLAPDEADEGIVRCILPGGEQFMRVHDCQMRGGLAKRQL